MGGPALTPPPKRVFIRYGYAYKQEGASRQGRFHALAGEAFRYGQRLERDAGEALCRRGFFNLEPDRTAACFRSRPCTRCDLLLARFAKAGVEIVVEPLLPWPWSWVDEGLHAREPAGWELTRVRLDPHGEWLLHRTGGRYRDDKGQLGGLRAGAVRYDSWVGRGRLGVVLDLYQRSVNRQVALPFGGQTPNAPEENRP